MHPLRRHKRGTLKRSPISKSACLCASVFVWFLSAFFSGTSSMLLLFEEGIPLIKPKGNHSCRRPGSNLCFKTYFFVCIKPTHTAYLRKAGKPLRSMASVNPIRTRVWQAGLRSPIRYCNQAHSKKNTLVHSSFPSSVFPTCKIRGIHTNRFRLVCSLAMWSPSSNVFTCYPLAPLPNPGVHGATCTKPKGRSAI